MTNLTLQNILASYGEFLEFVNTHRFRFVKDYSLSAANGVPTLHLRKPSIHGGIRNSTVVRGIRVFNPRRGYAKISFVVDPSFPKASAIKVHSGSACPEIPLL